MPDVAMLRGLAGLALAAALFAAGWTAQGWRWQAKYADRESEHQAEVISAAALGQERERVLADAFALIDATHTKEREAARAENDRLRADVERGAVRLRVAARCPSVLSAPGIGAGLGDGAAAELAADARPDYFALRAGIVGQRTQLMACQDALRAERREDIR